MHVFFLTFLWNEMFTCILLIIISCSTSGCVSPVRFMVPSSMMKAWTDGKEAWSVGSQCTDSIRGMLRKELSIWWPWCNDDVIIVIIIFTIIINEHNSTYRFYSVDIFIYPFTSDNVSSNLVLSVWLGTLPRPSVTFTNDCSTLLQEPVEE